MAKRNFIKTLFVAMALCLAVAIVPFFNGVKTVSADADSVTIAGTTVDMSSFETYEGASIRYDAENKGLRFITGIDEVVYNELNTLATENGYIVKFGTIVTYSYRVENCIANGYDFTKADLDKVVETAGSKYVDFGVQVLRDTENREVSTNVEYTAVLGISESNYSIPMSARGYVVISDGQSEEIFYAKYTKFDLSTEDIAKTLFEDFVEYGVDSDTKLAAIAEYTKGVDSFAMTGKSTMLPYTGNSANFEIIENQSIGGRSGVSKYILKGTNSWAERLSPAFTSPSATLAWTGASSVGHQNSVNRQNAMGINYVSFNFYLKDSFSIYYPTANKAHAYVKVSEGNLVYMYNGNGTTDTAITSKLKVYNVNGEEVTTTYANRWYTVVIDISCNIGIGTNPPCDTSISFNSSNTSVYFDGVKYYRTADACLQEVTKGLGVGSAKMDASAFTIMYKTDTADVSLTTKSLNGRDNVIFYDMNAAGDKKVAAYSGFTFAKATWELNNEGKVICTSARTANDRIKTSGIKYISFDVCRGTNSNFIMYVWDDTKQATLNVTYNTGNINSIPTNVKLFGTDGQEIKVGGVMAANTWYTIVIKVEYDETMQNWTSIYWCNPWTELGFDNIVYYYNDVPALWN